MTQASVSRMEGQGVSDVAARIAAYPRLALGFYPTPLDPMERLSRHLGGPRLFVKREDCSGFAMGGNKVRQLEFPLGDALAKGADTLVSASAVQSN